MIVVSCIVSVTILGFVQTERCYTENQLRAGRPRDRRPIPGRGVHFSVFQRLDTGPGARPPSLLFNTRRWLFTQGRAVD
jgi:hypothetical protein